VFSTCHYVDLTLGHYRSFDLNRDGVEKDQVGRFSAQDAC
jgi:hypothetical protein